MKPSLWSIADLTSKEASTDAINALPCTKHTIVPVYEYRALKGNLPNPEVQSLEGWTDEDKAIAFRDILYGTKGGPYTRLIWNKSETEHARRLRALVSAPPINMIPVTVIWLVAALEGYSLEPFVVA